MSWKVLVATLTLAVLALGAVWLWRIMPLQAWGEWNGESYALVAESWAVAYRGWPLLLAGALAGFTGAALVLPWMLAKADQADHQEQIERLTRERDTARAEAQQALAAEVEALRRREETAKRHEEAALKAQADADVAWGKVEHVRLQALQAKQKAEAAQRHAQEQIEAAKQQAQEQIAVQTRRAKNAICAAERIKRRVEGKKRFSESPKPRQTA